MSSKLIFMKFIATIIAVISLIFLSGCEALKYKKVSAKDFPPDPAKRVQKNMEEGRGFRIMDGMNKNKGTSYEFASSNPLWKATLDILDFMPLVSANYSGGVVITDWYSDENSPNESIKISIRFLSNEIRSDALSVNVFVRECDDGLTNCKISQTNTDLVQDLSFKILKKATLYERQKIENYKKENPYVLSYPDNKKGDKKKKK